MEKPRKLPRIIEDSLVFSRATRREALTDAWTRVWKNGGAAGGDGMSVETFRRGVVQRISHLADALTSGRYEPGPLRRVMIPKKSGGERPLDIPCVVDRVAQTAILAELGPGLTVNSRIPASAIAVAARCSRQCGALAGCAARG
ncbi:MAG: hypothetical protein R3D34_15930 [Nitratireductor sp.]